MPTSQLGVQATLALVLALSLVGGMRNARELRRLGARSQAHRLLWFLAMLPWVLAEGALYLGLPTGLPIAMIGVLIVISLVPGIVIRATGGIDPIVGLQVARDRIDAAIGRAERPESIRAQLQDLDRWRSKETDEYIELYRQHIEAGLDGTSETRESERVQRLNVLAAEYRRRLGME